jgi:hypothetical protein
MPVKSTITRTTVAALGAFAMAAPLAGAMPVDPIGGPHQAPFNGSEPAAVAPSPGSDAAQRSATEGAAVVVRSSDRTDAAQRTPGETTPITVIDRVPEPSPIVVADDGFEWGTAAIGAGAGLVLVLTAAGAFKLRPHSGRLA